MIRVNVDFVLRYLAPRGTVRRFGALVAAVVIVATVASRGEMSVAAEIPFSGSALAAGDYPTSVASGDIDGDGDVDLVVAWFLADRVSWVENTAGDGSGWTDHEVAENLDGAMSVAVGDLDGDGDLDLVSAAGHDDSVYWHENLGGSPPTFDPTPHVLTSLADYARSVAIADLDLDGDVDIVSCSSNDDEVAWFENDGASDPTFARHILLHQNLAGYPDPADTPIDVEIADLDRDGDPDIVWAAADNDRVGWLSNSGGSSPTFSSFIVSDGLPNGPRELRLADLDRDGDVDVVVTSAHDNSVRWFSNDGGTATTWTPWLITATAGFAWGLEVADLDSDGDVDVVVSSFTDDDLAWHDNVDGLGTSWFRREVSASLNDGSSVVVADLDGDGDRDIAAAEASIDEVVWFRNETIHSSADLNTRQLLAVLSGAGPNRIVAQDMDGDGDADVVVSTMWDRSVRWLDNEISGGGAFTPRLLYTAGTGRYTETIAVGDLDLDGDPDVVSAYTDLVPGTGSDAVYWHRNDGGEPLSFSHNTITTAADGPVSVETGDVDDDGDLDVVVGSMDDDVVRLFRNSGSFPFTFSSLTLASVGDPLALWVGDLHTRGVVDLVTASRADDEVIWLRNSGLSPPSFTPYGVTSGVDGPRAAAVADVDGDGALDIVVASEADDSIRWASNASVGPWPTLLVDGVLDGATTVASADLDRDGDVDIVASGYAADEVVWYDHSGASPPTWTEHMVSTDHNGPRSTALADLDRDGDLDVVVASFADSEVAWFENQLHQGTIEVSTPWSGALSPGQRYAAFRLTVSHDGRSGDGPIGLERLGLSFESAPGIPMTTEEASSVFEGVSLFWDLDESGNLSIPPDFWILNYSSMVLTDGAVTIPLPDAYAQLEVEHGTPRTYFVALEMADDLSTAGVERVRVTYRADPAYGDDASGAEDWQHGIPISITPQVDVTTDWLSFGLFADGFESGTTSRWTATQP